MTDIFEYVANNIKSYADVEEFLQQINSKASILSWKQYQQSLNHDILQSLKNFKHFKDAARVPDGGLKGIYFCLGDDGYSFGVDGALYFDEIDWAASAEYTTTDDKMNSKVLDIAFNLRSLDFDEKEISDLIFAFIAFIILQVMCSKEVKSIPEIANAGIALGFSDGDIFIFGYFINSKFILDIKVIAGGEYDKASTAPIYEEPHRAPTGPIFAYLCHNYDYSKFIEKHGLMDRLIQGGEVEAEKICSEFKEHIFLNRCHVCGAIKKTPIARICLTCGDFSEVKIDGV